MAVSSKMVDFSNVKEGGNFNKARVPSGDYLAKVTKVEDAKAKSDDVFQYLFTIKLVKRQSSSFPYYCKLTESQLWKLRNLLIAAGLTVPKAKMKLDPSKVVGKTIGVTIEDAEYEGKEQSEVAAVFPAAELMDGADLVDDDDEDDDDDDSMDVVDDDDEEEEEEEEEEADDEGDQYDAMDRLELRKTLKRLDASITTSTKQTDDNLRDLIRQLENSADDEEEEEEEEEEAPAPPKRAAKAKAKPAAKKKKAAEITDEELDELDIDDL